MIDILKSFASHRSVLLQKKKKKISRSRFTLEKNLSSTCGQVYFNWLRESARIGKDWIQFSVLNSPPFDFLHLSALRHHCRYFVSLLNRRNKSFYWLSLFNEMTRYRPCFFFVFIDRNVSLAWSSVTIIFDTTGSKIVKKSKCTLSLITMKKELPLKLFFRYNDKVATVCLSI